MATAELNDVGEESLVAALARPPVCPTELTPLRHWLRDVLAAVAGALDARVRAIRTVLLVFDARLDSHGGRLDVHATRLGDHVARIDDHAGRLTDHARLLSEQAAQIASLEQSAHRALPVATLPVSAARGALFQLAGDPSLYMGQGPTLPLLRFAPAVIL